MSFEQIRDIVKDNHTSGAYTAARFMMPHSTRTAIREHFSTMISSAFTEAAEMGAAKHGMDFHMAILPQYNGMTIHIDDTMPPNTWKLVAPNGDTLFQGTVNDRNE